MAEKAIDKLEMPTQSKDLIKAITRTYTENSGQFKADFISGKGDGQILLLHGPPGTGKTLTAGLYYLLASFMSYDLTAVQSRLQNSLEDRS